MLSQSYFLHTYIPTLLHNIHVRSMGHCNCILVASFFFYLGQFKRDLGTFDWGSTDRISNFINVYILYLLCIVLFYLYAD